MKRMMWLAGACLLGGLMVVTVVSGLRKDARAAEVKPAPAPAPLRATAANAGDVVINEVMYDPINTPDQWHEWIELYNTTDTVITITGWVISDAYSSDAIPTVIISPRNFVIIAANALSFTADYPGYTGVVVNLNSYIGNGLSNSGDQVELWENSTLIDALSYGSNTAYFTLTGVTAGHSLERSPLGTDTDSASDWIDQSTPTPGEGITLAADLSIAKIGPAVVSSGDLITYHITLGNVGAVTATSARVTDTLPAEVDFVAQASPFTFSQPGGALVWEAGDVPTSTQHAITVTVRVTETASGSFTNQVTATTTASETVTANNSADWTTTIAPNVRLYGLEPFNFGGGGEAAALINTETYTVPLDGWWLNDEPEADGVSFPTTATIAPGQILWIAEDADGFYSVWGFDADWAAAAITRPVPTLGVDWPYGLLNNEDDAIYLLNDAEEVIDAVAYGTGSATEGWLGSAVPYKYAYFADGQVLYRKLDQSTGLPVADTDTAADWAQDGDDPINGRKLRYPGWDLEELFFPAEISATANITLAAAPEGALDVVSQTIASAQQTLRIEAYTLKSVPLYEVIQARIQAGVVVTILLESGPAGGGIENTEEWIVHQLHNPPTSTVYFIGETAQRYRYQHAKFILVDDDLALVSTDNFGDSSMPADRKDNGTLGHRGFVAVTNSPEVVTRLADIFRRDCDPEHHLDTAPYDGSFTPSTPLPGPDWTTYTAPFVAPLHATADHLTVLHAPENALRDQDALLGLLTSAGSGDAIAVMQMNEPFTWTEGVGDVGLNPRLQALVTAAQNGAEVRLLLDGYYDGSNTETCLILNEVAGPNLTCRLANVTGLGIHAKVFLADVGGERWTHLGSINGTETSNKYNREVALQFRSEEAYNWMQTIFEHDWELGHSPMVHHIHLPLVVRGYVGPADYPLISEVFVNPGGDDANQEWIELYNPGDATSIAGWTLGDAINTGDYGDGRYSFPAGAQLAHGEVIVAAACATDFSAAYGFNPDYEWTNCDGGVPNLTPAGSWEGFGLMLGNTSDELLLLNGSVRVDSAAWGGASRVGVIPFTDFEDYFPTGDTLERDPADTDSDDCSQDFYVSYSPSPGVVAGN